MVHSVIELHPGAVETIYGLVQNKSLADICYCGQGRGSHIATANTLNGEHLLLWSSVGLQLVISTRKQGETLTLLRKAGPKSTCAWSYRLQEWTECKHTPACSPSNAQPALYRQEFSPLYTCLLASLRDPAIVIHVDWLCAAYLQNFMGALAVGRLWLLLLLPWLLLRRALLLLHLSVLLQPGCQPLQIDGMLCRAGAEERTGDGNTLTAKLSGTAESCSRGP